MSTFVMIIGVGTLLSFTTIENDKGTITEITAGGELNALWKDYRTWYKITKDAPNTGDPTGFLDGKHKGAKKAYREIYINKAGEATNTGSGTYKYPAGTVIVKEAYSSEKKWKEAGMGQLTIMVKLEAGKSPETGDWGYVMGAKGSVQLGSQKWAKFCSKCHVYAASKDYVFINSDFLKTERK